MFYQKNLKNILAIACIISTTSVFAESKRDVGKAYKQRDLGKTYEQCGLGGMLFGESSPILAVVSNVTWDLGTTATLTNISSDVNCVSPEVKTMAFISNSYNEIIAASAKGNGKYLETIVNISGKNIAKVRSVVASLIADNNYSTQTHKQKVLNLYNAII